MDRDDRNLVEATRVHRVVAAAHAARGRSGGRLEGLLRLLGRLIGLLGRLIGLLIGLLRRLVGLLWGLVGLLWGLVTRLRLLVTRLRLLVARLRLLVGWSCGRGGSGGSGGLGVRCEEGEYRVDDGIADLRISLLNHHHVCDIEGTTIDETNQTHLSRTLRLAKMRTTVFLRISPLGIF